MGKFVAVAREAKVIWKHDGFRALFRRYGWKLLVAVFCYYLVRDLTIYVLLPMLVFKAF